MWVYEKRLQFPVNIKRPDPKAAQIIISQYGGLYFHKVYYYVTTNFSRPPRSLPAPVFLHGMVY